MTKAGKVIFKILAVILFIMGLLLLIVPLYPAAIGAMLFGVFAFIYSSKAPTKTREEVIRDIPKTKQQIAKERIAANRKEGIACCPKCGSTSLSANKKGYGIGKGVVSAAAFGAIGLAAGNINANKVKITCLNCGYQFKPGAKR